MTEYSDQSVGDVWKRLLDAAVTRYLSEFGWYGSAEEGYRGSSWDIALPPFTGLTGTVRIRLNPLAQSSSPTQILPGMNYLGTEPEGAIDWYVFEIDPWASLYEPICDRINGIMQSWHGLPDPSGFDAPIQALEDAVDAVTPASQSEGSWSFTNVEVTTSMELMYKWISPQSTGPASSLLFAFDSAYGIPRITGVMSNQAQVAAALGYAVAGEKQIWCKARADFMTIAEDAATAMDITQGGGFDIDLGIVKAFVDLVSVFVPKQIGAVLDGLSTGIGFLDEVMPEQHVKSQQASVTGGTYEEICTSLEGALRNLEIAINNEEVEIINKLNRLDGVLGERPASDFHVGPQAGIDPEFVEATEIRINVGLVQTIGTRDVPTVAGAFLEAAEEAATYTGEGVWTRENGIGYGSNGPWPAWHALLERFDAMSTGTAKELVEAGRLLAVAAGWIESSDFDSKHQLDGHSDELARGHTEWSHT